MKIIGFNGGQYGDAIITLGAQHVIRKMYPDCHFTFALSRKYSAILPLFKGQPHINALHTWEGYDDEWPTILDREFIEQEKFDIVFHPMQRQDPHFYLKRHQVAACCTMYGLPEPETNEVSLVPNFSKIEDLNGWVAIAPFPNNAQGPKSLSPIRANVIASFLASKGIESVQIGGKEEPLINSANIRYVGTYEESVRAMASCKLLITGDTGLCWVASAYKIPVIGLYARSYYPQAPNCKNWQPINPNATYLEADSVDDIPIEQVLAAIKSKL